MCQGNKKSLSNIYIGWKEAKQLDVVKVMLFRTSDAMKLKFVRDYEEGSYSNDTNLY